MRGRKVSKFLRDRRREILLICVTLLGFLTFVPVFTYTYFAHDLVSDETIMNRNDTGITLYDRKNRPFFAFYNAKNRQFVSLSNISVYAQNAVVSVEDKDFYNHPGFSIRAIVRSLFQDLHSGHVAYGGSTITQQLVKNALLSSKKSFLRKYQEIILAQEIERRYSKKKILEMYLNSVYFGDGSFGIEEAAERDFGKHASQLSLSESALLAAILPAPSQYSPISGDKDGALVRQKIVLSDMVSQGYATETQRRQALTQKLTFSNANDIINTIAPHFALMVRDELIQKYGEETIARSGFKVKTSLDIDWQKHAQEEVEKQVENLTPDNVSNGAAVVEDPTDGEIRVLVGSRDWYYPGFGKFNVATSVRQPGSSFKPIVYVAALEEHLITAASILQDSPITYDIHPGTYSPHDYDGKFRGPVTVRRALANSLNVPAVQVIHMLGVSQAVSMAKNLGITTLSSPDNYGLSLVLGAAEVELLQHTNVYATFANRGMMNKPTLVTQITDKNGKVIYTYTPENVQVLDPRYVFIISSILSDNKTRAEEFGNTLTINRSAAVKTGTTNDFKDAWTMGYTPTLAVGVWVGNNNNQSMDNIAGSLGAAPIWRDLMETFLAGTPLEQFVIPSGVVRVMVCPSKIASTSAGLEYFAQGTQPFTSCENPSASTSALMTPSLTIQPSSPAPTATYLPTAQIPNDNKNDKGKH